MPSSSIQKREASPLATKYHNAVNVGTEEISQEDLNTPILKIAQPTTQDIPNKQDGSFYRSDLKEQFKSVQVNLVYVTTQEAENFNRTEMETSKIYFGFYKDTREPFKMYIRGWGLKDHRNFQTEVLSIKRKYKAPMLALTVELTTYPQQGTMKDSNKPYTIYRPLFTILKDAGQPVFESDQKRIDFLIAAVNRFKEISLTSSENDNAQNEVPQQEPVTEVASPKEEVSNEAEYDEEQESTNPEDEVDPNDIPF